MDDSITQVQTSLRHQFFIFIVVLTEHFSKRINIVLKKTACLGVMLLALVDVTYADAPVDQFIRIDGGHKNCVSDAGDEIKADQDVAAPAGKAWLNVQVVKSGYAPRELSCYPTMTNTKIPVQIGNVTAFVDGVTAVHMHMYADCGSGVQNIGKTISIECSLKVQEISLPQ